MVSVFPESSGPKEEGLGTELVVVTRGCRRAVVLVADQVSGTAQSRCCSYPPGGRCVKINREWFLEKDLGVRETQVRFT